jgi:hypothetical protein
MAAKIFLINGDAVRMIGCDMDSVPHFLIGSDTLCGTGSVREACQGEKAIDGCGTKNL